MHFPLHGDVVRFRCGAVQGVGISVFTLKHGDISPVQFLEPGKTRVLHGIVYTVKMILMLTVVCHDSPLGRLVVHIHFPYPRSITRLY